VTPTPNSHSDSLFSELNRLDPVCLIIGYGSFFVSQPSPGSDIDLIIAIKDAQYTEELIGFILNSLKEKGKELGRPVSPVILPLSKLLYELYAGNPLILNAIIHGVPIKGQDFFLTLRKLILEKELPSYPGKYRRRAKDHIRDLISDHIARAEAAYADMLNLHYFFIVEATSALRLLLIYLMLDRGLNDILDIERVDTIGFSLLPEHLKPELKELLDIRKALKTDPSAPLMREKRLLSTLKKALRELLFKKAQQ